MIRRKASEARTLIHRRRNENGLMQDAPSNMIDMPAIDALAKELNKPENSRLFDLVATHGNQELVAHLDASDADLVFHIKGTYTTCELRIPVGTAHLDTYSDVSKLVRNAIQYTKEKVDI